MSTGSSGIKIYATAKRVIKEYHLLRDSWIPVQKDMSLTWIKQQLTEAERAMLGDYDEIVRLESKKRDFLLGTQYGCLWLPMFSLGGVITENLLYAFLISLALVGIIYIYDDYISKKRIAETTRSQEYKFGKHNLTVLERSLMEKLKVKKAADQQAIEGVLQQVEQVKQALFHKSLNSERITLLSRGLELCKSVRLHRWTSEVWAKESLIFEVEEYLKGRWAKVGNTPPSRAPTNTLPERRAKDKMIVVSPNIVGEVRQSQPLVLEENTVVDRPPPNENKDSIEEVFPDDQKFSEEKNNVNDESDDFADGPDVISPSGEQDDKVNRDLELDEPKEEELNKDETQDPARSNLRAIPEFDPLQGVGTINAANHEAKSELGAEGERYALAYEKSRILSAGKGIKHLRQISAEQGGDKYGYDIYSETTDGEIRRIEVKTTKANRPDGFYMSQNEINVLNKFVHTYYIYRLSDYDEYGYNDDKFVVDEISGVKVLSQMNLVPKSFLVTKK